jgi:lipopolysaccharide export system protein LptA
MNVLARAIFIVLLIGATGPALAQKKPETKATSPLAGIGGNGKEPIKIDADRLDVFDRESRALFSGNVVAVQGETTMRCTTLTVFYEPQKKEGAPVTAPVTPPKAQGSAGPSSSDTIRRIECKGPVTVTSKDQVATSKDAVFDKVANKVTLTGDAALSDGRNVTRGEKIVYDLNTGIANVETNPGGRVRALFVPGEEQTNGKTKPQR